MSNFLVLLKHDTFRLFFSGGFYFASALFLFIIGLSYLLILNFYNNEVLEVCTMQSLFELFWVPALFIVPLLTMKVFSEDIRSGLLECMMASPISVRSLVLSKFLVTYMSYILMWTLAIIYPIAAQKSCSTDLTAPLWTANAIAGGFLFTLISSALFISVGVFASSLTKSQSVAGILTFFLLFTMFAAIRLWIDFCSQKVFFWKYANFSQALDDLCAGIVDSRFVVFNFSATIFALLLASISLEFKSLR